MNDKNKYEITNTPLVSVIVPVYNVEKYIRRCLDSLLNQTLSEIEILLIDDGSTDKSGVICDEYADKDKRICVVHKKNNGVASARQAGTDIARGEYVIHADPDDWVEPIMLEVLLNKARETDADVVICDFYTYNARGESKLCQRPSELTPDKVLHELFHRLHGSLWNKFVRHECYNKYNLHFIPDVNYCEDVLIWVQLFQNQEVKIAYLDKAFYHYNQCNVESITQKWTPKFVETTRNYHKALELLLPANLKKELEILKMIFTLNLWYHNEIAYYDLKSKKYRINDIIHCDILRIKQKIGYVLTLCRCPILARLVLNLKRVKLS